MADPYLYTPPQGDALAFNGDSEAYSPPPGNLLMFTIGAAADGTSAIVAKAVVIPITAQARLELSWAAIAGVAVRASGDLTLHVELAVNAQNTLRAVASAFLTTGYEITGVVTEAGAPQERVLRVYAADTGGLLAETSSDPVTGEYRLDLGGHKTTVYVLCLGSPAYGPLAHGPVTPVGY